MPLNPQPQDVVIVGAARTPQGRLLGALSRKTASATTAQTTSWPT